MNTEPLLQLEGLPVLQNKVYRSPQEAVSAPRGKVVLRQDPVNGIVQNSAFDADLLRYDTDYQNEQGCSPSFQAHLGAVLRILDRVMPQRQVLEIGCGKAFFLEQLLAAGYDATGVDPAYEGTNPSVIKAPFSRELGVSAPGLVMRHVLEHIQDPLAFLESIAQANGGAGTIYIEVPCFDWICAHRAWFDVFYEHVNYFRASDFKRLFGSVIEIGQLFGGQYLYVVADLASLRRPADPGPLASLPPDFLAGIARCREQARRPCAVWGASSKGVLFAHHLAAAGVLLDGMIDINPVKQGRFAAGTGLPIHAPEDAARLLAPRTTVFVMNPNYHAEIAAGYGQRFTLVNVDLL